MHKFTFYIELDANGRIPESTRERLEKYIAISKYYEITLFWMYGDTRVTYDSISSLIRFEKKECIHKGITIKNRVVSSDSRIGILTSRTLKKYNFVCRPDYGNDQNGDILRMSFGNQPESCDFNSCLGNVLTIFKNGSIGVCPFHKNDIELCDDLDIEDIHELFNTESFISFLKGNIERRNNCKSRCEYFSLCKGGCAFMETNSNCDIHNRIEEQKSAYIKSDMSDKEYREQKIITISNMYKV